MEVGDYVRTEDGIAKYIGDKATEEGTYYFVDRFFDDRFDGWENIICKDEIIKSRPKIIDLIEVGDYVNGYLVTDISLDAYKNKIIFVGQRKNEESGYYRSYYNEQINSVVTKEQFSQMEYKI